MARLYADEGFPLDVVEELRQKGHDVPTTQEASRAGRRIPDPDQLSFAHENTRAILTLNRRDFMRLHIQHADHCGIIVCTVDPDTAALAGRIDSTIHTEEPLTGKL